LAEAERWAVARGMEVRAAAVKEVRVVVVRAAAREAELMTVALAVVGQWLEAERAAAATAFAAALDTEVMAVVEKAVEMGVARRLVVAARATAGRAAARVVGLGQ